jgi:hypothetical protein
MFSNKRSFSIASYLAIIDKFIENNYSIISFRENDVNTPYLIIRHDIDLDPRYAYEIAQKEYLKGVRASYFFPLRSPFFNVLSKSNVRYVNEIYQMGHDIGSHIDLAMYGGVLDGGIHEVDILKRYFPFLNTNIISLHHPGGFDQIKLYSKHPSIANVYGKMLSKQQIYISDSTGKWRYGHPIDTEAFKTGKSIQLLTHPIWWAAKGKTPKEKISNWMVENRNTTIEDAKYYLPSLSLK